MRFSLSRLALCVSLLHQGSAAHVAVSADKDAVIENRGLVGGLVGGVLGTVLGLGDVLKQLDQTRDPRAILDILNGVRPRATPTSLPEVQETLQGIYGSATPTNLYKNIALQLGSGLGPLIDDNRDLIIAVLGYGEGEDSVNNPNNPTNVSRTVYPTAAAGDAPYSLPEAQLRAAIRIPAAFTFGAKPPVLLVPGTWSYGGSVYGPNLRKLLTDSPHADPVWLNVPGAMAGDAQVNSEYIAYAINYLSAICSNSSNSSSDEVKVSVVSFSQGGLDTQWAFTFWPSTRAVVSNFLPVSPDFHGTVLVNVLCLSADSDVGLGPCDPAAIQQEYTSHYIATLRAAGGDSAYVPTTTFYSGLLDEIVQPQHGTGASAYLLDARGVGVVNVEAQVACPPASPGAGFYGHAGMLYHPLTYALVVDALSNGGPADLGRIDIGEVCSHYAAPGLGLEDVVATVALIPMAAGLLLSSLDKRLVEPPIMPYANQPSDRQ
ncbi:uncharacterized protein PG998_004399 [Apiospora kogelbergensis]|uniref:uncharacterized protein n=1 Tax=Apiospora kogelbergensis TaxID=1337665 RepID=UPI003131BFAD